MIPTLEDRVVGCLLAGTLGDACGGAFEGRVGSFDGRWPDALYVSDDTRLTLATAAAIAACGCVEPEWIAAEFAGAYRERRVPGVGAATLKALQELAAGGHWATVGATGERAAGNGAAMRIAPTAFFLDPDDERDRRTIRDVCRITHRHDEAYVGALAIVRAIRRAAADAPLDDEFWAALATRLPDALVRDRLKLTRDERLDVAGYAGRFAASGHVVDSVPLAIVAATECVAGRATLEETFAALARAGGDVDTIASLAGQIAGAFHGTAALPAALATRVEDFASIEREARAFARVVVAERLSRRSDV